MKLAFPVHGNWSFRTNRSKHVKQIIDKQHLIWTVGLLVIVSTIPQFMLSLNRHIFIHVFSELTQILSGSRMNTDFKTSKFTVLFQILRMDQQNMSDWIKLCAHLENSMSDDVFFLFVCLIYPKIKILSV